MEKKPIPRYRDLSADEKIAEGDMDDLGLGGLVEN